MKQLNSLKNLVIVVSICAVFTSCSKKDVLVPVQNSSTQSVPVSFQDENISISGFRASQILTDNLQVCFSILYENNISKIEILSGASQNQLCSFYSLSVSGNSNAAKNFAISDTNIKGSTMYYMIKYTLSDGNWGYTPVCSLQVKQ